MDLPFRRSGRVSLLCALLFVAATSQKQGKNFSGDYSLIATEGQFAVSMDAGSTLKVEQTSDSLEITRVEGGKKSFSKFSLKTGAGEYTGADGKLRKATEQLKSGKLFTDVLYITPAEGATPRSEFHVKEEWALSDDARTLILRRKLEMPGVQPTSMSGVETYSRN